MTTKSDDSLAKISAPRKSNDSEISQIAYRKRDIFGDDSRLRRRTIVIAALAVIVAMPIIASLRVNIGDYNSLSLTIVAITCAVCFVPLLSAYTPSMDRVSGHIIVATLCFSLVGFAMLNGTLWAPEFVTLPLLPLVAGFLIGSTAAWITTAAVVIGIAIMCGLAVSGAELGTSPIVQTQQGLANGLFVGLISFLVGLIAWSYERRSRLLQAALIHSAMHDQLTGLANRTSLQSGLVKEANRLRRASNYPVSLIVVDIDHFKQFNDCNGHQQGDKVLRRVAEAIKATACRASDITARYGGDEFVIVLPNTGNDDALLVAERLRAAVEAQHIELAPGSETVVTLSIGVATRPAGSYQNGEAFAQDLMARADSAMYRSKHAGRNRVMSSPVQVRAVDTARTVD